MNNYNKIAISSVASILGILFLGYSFSFITDRFAQNTQDRRDISVEDGKLESKVIQVAKPKRQQLRLPRYPYQDILVNNKVVKRGRGPSCKSRYNIIKQVLAHYNRPITVLDIGAAEGYMSFKIAHDFDASCVMIEHPSGESGGFLKKLCELNTDCDNVMLLYKKITADELKKLSECEHFDVVLAFNVLHHFPNDKWKIAADAILNMSDYAIIETPPVEDTGSIGKPTLPGIIDYIEKNKGRVIAKTSRRHTRPDTFANMYLVKGRNVGLRKRGLLELESPGYKIISNTSERFLASNKSAKKIDFPQGINLMTFKLFNGVYPKKSMIKTSIAKLREKNYSLVPQDIVIQGQNLVSMSECKDKIYNDDQMLKYAYGIVETSDINKVMEICKLAHGKTKQFES